MDGSSWQRNTASVSLPAGLARAFEAPPTGTALAAPLPTLNGSGRMLGTVSPLTQLLLWALGLMGVALLLALSWAMTLRNTVTEQTGIILRRLQQEVALEERYRDLFENASDIITTHDLDGNITSMNKAAERLFGCTREEVLNVKFTDMVIPEDLPRVEQMHQHKLEHGGTTAYEATFLSKDGRRVTLEIRTRLIYQDGQPVGIQGNSRDITERKKAEAELKRAKEAAEAANRAKSEFLANISHEIRTPMNGIIGMTQFALETPLNAEQRDYLSTIKTSADSLLGIVNDVLDFSRIEAKRLELECVSFDLEELLAATVQPMAVRAAQKGLRLNWHLGPNIPRTLTGDPARLRQITLNLAGNAVKFTERGEVSLLAEVASETPGEAVLQFTVIDTGVGIPADQQKIIFEPFSQADGSSTRRFGGTGLGLTICSRLVKMMGGRIWVESEPGRGSKFHFTARFGLASEPAEVNLPSRDRLAFQADAARVAAAPLPAATQAVTIMPVNGNNAGVRSASGLRILLTEDNPVNQKVARRILEKHGHEVVPAENGLEALRAIERDGLHQFDLTLMDVQMPEMDGFQATEAIREREPTAGVRVPIIAMTAHAMAGDRERCLAQGMDGYISKPIAVKELLKIVESTHRDRKSAAQECA
jgi:PAS domain S-box-containing protein